jgi:EmrB/QacA subfamily drug resistance transporter
VAGSPWNLNRRPVNYHGELAVTYPDERHQPHSPERSQIMAATTNRPVEESDRRRWLGLAALCAAFFMVILDVAIVNVALPTIKVDLDFSQQNLQWVVSAYALTFGGLLLLGGRAADLLGRRRVFMLGVAVFAASSLLAGLAWSEVALIVARAAQGVGAAMMTPAALSILMTTFREGAERNTALGVWGAVGASGGTVGVLLGGILTDTIGWEWIFFLNVPVGLAVIAVAPVLLRESRTEAGHRRFDVAGALSVTAAVGLLVYALVEAHSAGWASGQTLGLIGASAALFALFVAVELRSRAPIMPFSIFRIRAVTGSNVAGLALGGAVFGMIFILTLYMQQVLSYSPLETGVAWLGMSLTALVSSVAASVLVTRLGPRIPLAGGLVVASVGLILLARIPSDGHYVADLLPGLLVTGLGLGSAFVSMSIGALEGVSERDAGLASGLVNTTQQVGGALGVAVLSTLAISRSDDLLAGGTAAPVALTEGFQIALIAAAGFAVAGAIGVLALVRRGPRSEPVAETVSAEPAVEGISAPRSG